MPLLTPDHVVAYGDALPDDDHEHRLLTELGIMRVNAAEVHQDPPAAAARARARVETVAPEFVVHVDVDVLEVVGAPLADVPDSGGDPVGLTLEELATGLAEFAASPGFAGLVVTEVNPDHVPHPDVLRHFARTLTTAVSVPAASST